MEIWWSSKERSQHGKHNILSLLADAIEARPIHRNLVIHLIRLVDDAVNVLILRVNLLAHGLAQLVKRSSAAMDGVPVVKSVCNPFNTAVVNYSQVIINLVLHLVILTISLKLILGSISQAL